RYTFRMLGRQRGFTVAALATLALGIGANVAIFSVIYGVLLRPLPYPGQERIVRLSEVHPGANAPVSEPLLSNLTLVNWEAPRTLAYVGAYDPDTYTVAGGDRPERLPGAGLTPSMFDVLGVAPRLGRRFEASDTGAGAAPVVILSDGFWRDRFGGDEAALGRVLRLDDAAYTIVGVMPPGFYFPGRDTRFWIPYEVQRPEQREGGGTSISIFPALGRLAPGATPAQAEAEGTAAARAGGERPMVADLIFGKGGPVEVRAVPVAAQITASIRPALLVLAVGVGLVLLIACANVANLFLSRGAARERELAVRAAIGAGRGRLVTQLLTESLVIAGAGGALGLATAWGLTRVLPLLAPENFPRIADVRVDGAVLAFAAAVSLAAGVASGLVPALRASRVGLVPALRDGAGASSSRRLAAFRSGLLVAEAALAVVLLVGAGLLVRSFVRLVQVDAGFDPANVVTARLYLPATPGDDQPARDTADRLLDELRAMPGVLAAGASNMAPFGNSTAISGFSLPETGPDGQEVVARALSYTVTPGYAEALALHLVDGRLLAPGDRGAATQALVVNEEFVRAYLDDGRPVVGRRYEDILVRDGEHLTSEIVGVVGNVLKDGPDRQPQPEIYRLPRDNRAFGRFANLVIRTSGEPLAVVPALRAALARIDPAGALDEVATLASQKSAAIGQPRFAATLLAAFAAVALLLAAVGLYGVLSYNVARRQREIGIRSALGATRAQLVGMVVRQGMAVTLAGLLIGVGAAAGLTQLMGSLLFGIEPLDLPSFLAAPAVLAVVALAACLVPARRAALTDPADALRCE
ncbi:MAG: ABC transporter permease, partial [Vicinamibacterales bacterium]